MMDKKADSAPGEDLNAVGFPEILKLLPHRYPFLMIDKIRDMTPTSATGIKNVTINEPFFQGHFEGQPIMPGVLLIEAMAQTAIALVSASRDIDTENKLAFFISMDNVRFRRPVVPGDQVELPVKLVRVRQPVWKFHGEAYVDGQIVAEADYAAMAVDRE